MAFAANRGQDAPALRFAAAKQLELLAAVLARETCLRALIGRYIGWPAVRGEQRPSPGLSAIVQSG